MTIFCFVKFSVAVVALSDARQNCVWSTNEKRNRSAKMIIVIVHGSAQFFLSRGRRMGPHPCHNESQTRVECHTHSTRPATRTTYQTKNRYQWRQQPKKRPKPNISDNLVSVVLSNFYFVQYYFIILERVASHCMPRMEWVVPLSVILRNWAKDRYEIVVCRKIEIRTALEGNGTLSTNWSVACSCPLTSQY